MQFIDRFLRFITNNALFESNQPLLLAVSGGKDSTLLAHLIKEAGFPFAIAHCNFQLRDEDSDLDEAFVKDLAAQFKVDFYSTRFPTEDYANEKQISIQMAARDLRYQWLEEIRAKHHYSYLVVAHHATDSAETVLLNLLRGTGIAGLGGIHPKRGHIVRPLLNFTAKEVADEVAKRYMLFREDASNASTKYKRNSLRLEVLPVLHKLNPDLEKIFLANGRRLRSVEIFLQNSIEEMRPKLFKEFKHGEFHLNLPELQALDPIDLWLYELFKPYGFTESVLFDLQRDWSHGSGRQFFSSTHQIIVDRYQLILKPIQEDHQEEVIIKEFPREINWYGKQYMVYTAENRSFVFTPSTQILDCDSLKMPLKVRSWEEGDRFIPLGMKGSKKLSDFLISLKVPINEKRSLPVIEDANNSIVAILPYRIDDGCKVTAKTKKVIIFEELKNG